MLPLSKEWSYINWPSSGAEDFGLYGTALRFCNENTRLFSDYYVVIARTDHSGEVSNGLPN
jgi:hypothetical protein